MKHKLFGENDNGCKLMTDFIREAFGVSDQDFIIVGDIELGLCIPDAESATIEEAQPAEAVWAVDLTIDGTLGCITVNSAFEIIESSFTGITTMLLKSLIKRQLEIETGGRTNETRTEAEG